jgi:hypothetical protein
MEGKYLKKWPELATYYLDKALETNNQHVWWLVGKMH